MGRFEEFDEEEIGNLKSAIKSLKRKEKRGGKHLPKAGEELYRRLGAVYASQARAVDYRRTGEEERHAKWLREKNLYEKAGEAYEKAAELSSDEGAKTNNLKAALRMYDEARVKDKVIELRRKLGKEGSGGLEKTASATIAIIALLGGLFFLSSNLTGNAIGNLTLSTSNIIGTILLVIGLVGGFFWFRSRKK